MKFTAYGHPNITATHDNTLEFTRDKNITRKGDCIVAVSAQFNYFDIKKILKKDEVIITMQTKNNKETIRATPNPDFADKNEMVIRITDFKSERTFATRADKSAAQLNRNLVEELQDSETRINITLE